MAIQAIKVEPWLLVSNDVKVRTVKHITNDTENKKIIGWLEQADHFVVVQRRHFYGLQSFTDEAGNELSGSFSWYVGGGRTLSFIRASMRGSPKWICTNDRIEITDHITGEGWETQTWELQSKFEAVPGSYYESDADVPAP